MRREPSFDEVLRVARDDFGLTLAWGSKRAARPLKLTGVFPGYGSIRTRRFATLSEVAAALGMKGAR